MLDPDETLPVWESVLAVVAHPDDESFGLGAVISGFVASGATVAVLCFTHGEASTLHGVEGDLASIREGELAAAAAALGVGTVSLLDYPDGALADVDLSRLAHHVRDFAADVRADGLLVFDETGITGHPDHLRATAASVDAAARLDIDVLAWTVPESVAQTLNDELGTDMRGQSDIDLTVEVERGAQRRAVDCHPSQAVPTSALWRRLELSGNREHLRWLRGQD